MMVSKNETKNYQLIIKIKIKYNNRWWEQC